MFQIIMVLQIKWKKYRTAQHLKLEYHASIQSYPVTPASITLFTNSCPPGQQARQPSIESICTYYGHAMTPPHLKKKQFYYAHFSASNDDTRAHHAGY